jgi:hypothetical protein
MPRTACIFTYMMEIVPDKYHEKVTFFAYLADGFSFVGAALFVMYLRDVYLFLNLISFITMA